MSFWLFEISWISKEYLEKNIPWGKVLNTVLEVKKSLILLWFLISRKKDI